MVESDLAMYIIDLMHLRSCILLPRTFRVAEAHTHDTYEAHYVIGGRGSFEARERPMPVRPGDFFYTRPGTMHRMEVPESSYLLQYVAFLDLDPETDGALVDDLDRLLGEGRVRRLGDRYHVVFAELSRQSLSVDASERRAASARMAAFLYEVMVGVGGVSRGHPAIERALDFMRSHLEEAYTLDDLLEDLHLDRSYFIRLFKRNIGVPPMKYAMSLKMSVAADLLRTTDEPLAAVGSRVGFDDQYHFAKRFKQWSGVSPGAYRGR